MNRYSGLLALLVTIAPHSAAREAPSNTLTLLIAAPWSSETAMKNDVEALIPVLRHRGLQEPQMMILDQGALEREAVLRWLRQAHGRTQSWKAGSVFLYVSGHGHFTGTTPEDARLALQLKAAARPSPETAVFWDEIFAALDLPSGVTLTLLLDT
jgi:hypothetical protein